LLVNTYRLTSLMALSFLFHQNNHFVLDKIPCYGVNLISVAVLLDYDRLANSRHAAKFKRRNLLVLAGIP
jgi:hypothetical protein